MIRYIAGIMLFVLVGVANATELPSPSWTISVDVDEMSGEPITIAESHYFMPGPDGKPFESAWLVVRKHPRWGGYPLVWAVSSNRPKVDSQWRGSFLY